MSIASEITRIKTNIDNAYIKIAAKGGTVPTEPADKNSANLADTIDTIPGEKTKYGMTIDNLFGNVDSSGSYSEPAMNFTPDFSTIKNIPIFGFYYKFYSNGVSTAGPSGVINFGLTTANNSSSLGSCFKNRTRITGISMPNLTTVSGASVFASMCEGCTGILSANFGSLTTITGSSAFSLAFSGCTKLASVDLHSLVSVGASSLSGAFKNCSALTSINLENLETVGGTSGGTAMQDAFNGCNLSEIEFTSLKTIAGSSAMARAFANNLNMVAAYFPALEEVLPAGTVNQLTNMFQGNTNMTAIHFPAAMQTRIEGLTGYATKFGATNATIYFDL